MTEEDSTADDSSLNDSFLAKVARLPQRDLDLQRALCGVRMGGNDGQRFEIVEAIGAGAMGVVFAARDHVLQRMTAIKFLYGDDVPSDQVQEILTLEARAIAKLNHENIVRVFDIGSWNQLPFLVMEYLEGRSLHAILWRERLDAARAVELLIQVGRGLAHAHRTCIIHRDLKPSNVFLLKDDRVKILDFGLAGATRSLGCRSTPARSMAGTPSYMAPEQWKGEPQDDRTDLWALGVMLFEMLASRLPFEARDRSRLGARLLSDEPIPSIRMYRPDLPSEADLVLRKALSKNLGERFQSAEEMVEALSGLSAALKRDSRRVDAAVQLASPAHLSSERRQVTLLSCVLSGFSTLCAEMDLDDAGELFAVLSIACSGTIKQYGGNVLSAVGGRLLACFGYPVAEENGAQQAVRAALGMKGAVQRVAQQFGGRFVVQIGVHSGTAIVAPSLDGGGASTSLIQGDVPTVAISLSERAGPDQVLVSQRTWALVKGMFAARPEGIHAVERISRPLQVYRILNEVEVTSRFDRAHAVNLTPLVGRRREVDLLFERWKEAKRGQGSFALISGEAGIGKSRLVDAVTRRIIEEAHTRLTCQCWPHFQNSAFYPLTDLLVNLMRIQREESSQEKLMKLERTLVSLGLSQEEHVPLLASLLSIPTSDAYPALSLAPELLKARTIEVLITLLLRMVQQRPVLFVVEDVHWMDASTHELLDALLDRISPLPILVVLTFRPGLRLSWRDRPYLREIHLHRLSPELTASMVKLLAGDIRLPEGLLHRLVTLTDGMPLFVEELTQVVLESWPSAAGEPPISSDGLLSSLAIPDTLQELLLARLDRLTSAGKEVAQLGATAGREFTYELIQCASHVPEEALQQGLMQLVESGLLRCQGRVPDVKYRFKHALIQEAAYHSLVKGKRRSHHQRIATTLVERFSETVERQPELAGYHYAEAGDAERAIIYLERAGQMAVRRSANVDAISHFRRALRLLGGAPESVERNRKELDLLLELGPPTMAVNGYAAPEVESVYARARELCMKADDRSQLFPSVHGLWQFSLVAGQVQLSFELGQQLVSLAESAGDAVYLLLAHRAIATSELLLGHLRSCLEHTEKGFSFYDRRQHRFLAFRHGHDPGVAHAVYAAWSLWLLGYPDQALSKGQEAAALADGLGHPFSIAYSLGFLAMIQNYRGEHQAAAETARHSIGIATTHHLALWLAWGTLQLGWALAGVGDEEEGIAKLREGLEGWMQTGARAGLTYFPSTLVWALWKAGRLDEAAAVLEDAECILDKNGEFFYEAEVNRLKGELILARSPAERVAAKALFRKSLEIAAEQGAKAWELRTATSLARLLWAEGRPGEAFHLLAAVHDRFTEGLETGDPREAKHVLDLLSAEARRGGG